MRVRQPGREFDVEPHNILVRGVLVDNSKYDLDLSGCFAKLDRAREHLHTLHDELSVFFNSEPYGVTGKLDAQSGWYVFRIDVRREMPARIAILVGEYVHQLRSILDHLGYQLALWKLRNEGKTGKVRQTSFIIETSQKKFREKQAGRPDNIPQEWKDLIEALQPYHASEGPLDPHAEALAIIEKIWNIDKHSLVFSPPRVQPGQRHGIPSWYIPNADAGPVLEDRLNHGADLKQDAEVTKVRLKPVGPNPQVDMDARLSVEIAMDDGTELVRAIAQAGWWIEGMLRTFPTAPAGPQMIPVVAWVDFPTRLRSAR
jgi:hypothetical protein